MKQNMTTAVNTRRMRGKRWGYEGIKTRFRGVKKVYPSITWSDDPLRTNVRISCYLHKPPNTIQGKGLICFFVHKMRPIPTISKGILSKPRSTSGIAYPSRERPASGHQNILVLRNAPSKTRCIKRPIVKARKFFLTVLLLAFLPIVNSITATRNPTTVTTLNTGTSAPTITHR